MKLCNDTITVFNARVDPDAGGNVWVPTVIAGASWFLTDASTVDATRGGLVAANRATIRIPEDADAGGKVYADPMSYAEAEDVTGLWTLQAGDVIVKGSVEGGTTSSVTPQSGATPSPASALAPGEGFWTPAMLKKVYADCVTVLGVTDNRRAPREKHWRVTGT